MKTSAMKRIALWPMVSAFSFLALSPVIESPTTGRVTSQQTPLTTSCSAPEYRQFDFWVGDWDAFEEDSGKKVARVQVKRILDGCVLQEDYQGANDVEGQSITIYDSSRKLWHQTWVTNGGALLVIEGAFRGGEMVLNGVDHQRDEQLVRGTWKPAAEGVRETAVISSDAGKTWKPWFDLLFRPHKP
ncbi:MAG: hypothetical protein WBL63_00780 [Candidatus Acidiferrum sp.]